MAKPGNYLPVVLPNEMDLVLGDPEYIEKLRTDPSFTPEKWAALKAELAMNAAGPIQHSIICKDDACDYAKTCALKKQGFPVPEDKPCPIEETFRAVWLQQLQHEIGVDADGFAAVDTGIVVDVVNTMIELHRGQQEVAISPKIAVKVIAGMDKHGDPIVDLKMNPVLFALKATRKMKAELLKHLIATREARSKDKSRKSEDAARDLNALRRATDGALERLGVVPGIPQVRDAVATVVDTPPTNKVAELAGGGGVASEHLDEYSKELGIKPVSDAPDLDAGEA